MPSPTNLRMSPPLAWTARDRSNNRRESRSLLAGSRSERAVKPADPRRGRPPASARRRGGGLAARTRGAGMAPEIGVEQIGAHLADSARLHDRCQRRHKLLDDLHMRLGKPPAPRSPAAPRDGLAGHRQGAGCSASRPDQRSSISGYLARTAGSAGRAFIERLGDDAADRLCRKSSGSSAPCSTLMRSWCAVAPPGRRSRRAAGEACRYGGTSAIQRHARPDDGPAQLVERTASFSRCRPLDQQPALMSFSTMGAPRPV